MMASEAAAASGEITIVHHNHHHKNNKHHHNNQQQQHYNQDDPSAITIPSSVSSENQVEVVVCCGCRPRVGRRGRRRRRRFKWKKNQYHDAQEINNELQPWSEKGGSQALSKSQSTLGGADDLQFFFDAEEDELGENDFPLLLDAFNDEIVYKRQEKEERKQQRRKRAAAVEDERVDAPYIPNYTPMDYRAREPSERYHKLIKSTEDRLMFQLMHPRVVIEGGAYPGTLTDSQLEECHKFIQGLHGPYRHITDQIYSFRDIEDPPFTICRWLRATKFDADAILKRCAENQAQFVEASKQFFHPDPSVAIGAPFPVFLSQYPFLPIGHGKMGCPVNYFQAGRINPEGILAMTSVEQVEGYFWWSFMHKMKEDQRKIQAQDPNMVRCEGINVIDLQGLSRAALSSETMAVIKVASKISDFFPETLHCMLIINAPGFFSMAWGLIKKFIDPQTARRIKVISGKENGLQALRNVISIDQIPKDYGGGNISIEEAFRNEANDPDLLRQGIELVHVRGGKSKTTQEWALDEGEYMDIHCFTRSCSSATITVRVNGEMYRCVEKVVCKVDKEGKPKAATHTLATKVIATVGALVSVEVQDMDNAHKKHSGQSRGYFLIAADIKRLEQNTLLMDATQRRISERVLEEKKDDGQLPDRTPVDYTQRRPSQRFVSHFAERPVEDMIHQLKHPRAILEGRAYPGTLSEEQLEECRKFLQGLQGDYKHITEQIYSVRDIEDPAFTICRWLRATKFDAEAILKRCSENQPLFDEAAKHQFYPDPSEAIGASYPVYLTQYPFLPVGFAKNGCVVNYFQAGRINPEGVMAMTSVEKLAGYFWWGYMHKMKEDQWNIQAKDPHWVRLEGVTVIDLQGLNRAGLTSETMSVIKLSSKIGDFFPDTCNSMLILNAPGFFSIAWGLIKKFIDPQTASRIKLYSSKEQGMKALRDVIDLDQIPKDYGGTNITMEEAFRLEANDPSLLRQGVELVHVKGGKSKTTPEWKVEEGEYMDIDCYTRSVSGATLTVHVNGSVYNCVEEARGDLNEEGEPTAKCHKLATKIKGIPGGTVVSIEVKDLNDAEKKHKGKSCGYFLVAADIKKLDDSTEVAAMPEEPAQQGVDMYDSEAEDTPPTVYVPDKTPMDYLQRESSQRFTSLVRSSEARLMLQLTQPRAILEGRAYPGTLNDAQLEECLKFLHGLHHEYRHVTSQVFSVRDIEDPAFTICRWLRATKFDAEAILKRLSENQPLFDEAAKHQFYPDPSKAIGAPYPVYLTQYPFLPVGFAKNGCVVSYFQAGRINPEGVMALSSVEKLAGYFWWGYMHKMKDDQRKIQAKDPNWVRLEGVTVIDLEGLNRAALTSETMAVIKLSSKVGDFFPDTCNSMLILNAPGFFKLAWGLIKKFIDPQTASRIKLYSNRDQGLQALREIVDIDQIPRDYGGTNMTMAEAFVQEADDPTLIRQGIDLVHVGRGKSKSTPEWRLEEGEYMDVNCYTRSCSGAKVTVTVNGSVYNCVEQVSCRLDAQGQPVAAQFSLASKIKASPEGTKVSVQVQDLDNADRQHKANSRGYFLVAAVVRRLEDSES